MATTFISERPCVKCGNAEAERIIQGWLGQPCPVCGNDMIQRTRHSPVLDRVDNAGAYSNENVAVLCWRCNTVKADFTIEQLRSLPAYAESPPVLSKQG